jgi:Helicase conserved C-terminal domain
METWDRCKRVIEEEIGKDSELLDYFSHGIVVHHAQLPRRVRIAIEDAVRDGAARIIVATTTLAQGVNLPIKTVLVRGLYHGHGDMVSPLTFWNICGRAGRAMKEDEGQILFCCDETAKMNQKRKQDQAIHTVIQTLQSRTVISALRLALHMILERWRETHPAIDVVALSLCLAENDVSWVAENQRQHLEVWLDILDGHLLALTEEFELDGDSPDRLQEILEGSLLLLQLRDQPIANFTADSAVKLLHSRVRYIFSRLPYKSTRTRMYKLGMRLSSSLFVDERRDELVTLLRMTDEWDNWEDGQRGEFLAKFATVLLDIRDIRPDNLPKETDIIIIRWIMGENAVDIAADSALRRRIRDRTLC